MKILLVRLRLIGDVVFTTPIIAALRNRFPSARLSYLVEDAAAPVVAANPHLSDVIITRHSRGLERVLDDVRLARQLRADRFDAVIDLHGGPRSGWLTWASGAPTRLGYDVPGRSWMYTRVIPRPTGYRPRHAVENQWDLLAAFDEAFPTSPRPDAHPVQMWPGAADDQRVLAALSAWSIPVDGQLVVLHVSAGNPFRRWSEASFGTVALELARASRQRWVLITAGPSDQHAVERILQTIRTTDPATASRVVAADALSLGSLRALCDRAALFIGGDSGPLHIAATSRVPIVAIYGPTLPERSAPWRAPEVPDASVEPGPLPCRPCDQRVCAPGDFRCLSGIRPDAVLSAAQHLLGDRL